VAIYRDVIAGRRLTAAAVAIAFAICAVYAIAAPARGQEHFVDQVINRVTVEHMEHGAGYYDAMDRALRQYNGPAGSVRAYRLPVPFLLWRLLGSARAIWLVYVSLVAATVLVLARLTEAPVVLPLVAWYLLRAARPHNAEGFVDQYLVVELWTVPFVAGAMLASLRRRWWLAAGLALVATAFRELSGLVLLGGLVAAFAFGRPRRPWLVAVALAAVGLAVHAVAVDSHLVAHGTEIKLLGTGGLLRVFTMMGVGLPRPTLLGPLLWMLASVGLASDRDRLLQYGPYFALPLVGLAVGRDYWGFLVVPFALMWAGEGVRSAGNRRSTHPRL
jgi:hypothetical protein